MGARGGGLPLLLSTVFHIGNASNNISWESYEHFARHPAVGWTIPISMGDSYRGYRVVATDGNFYAHYQYRGGQALRVSEGREPAGVMEAVVGAEVARRRESGWGRGWCWRMGWRSGRF